MFYVHFHNVSDTFRTAANDVDYTIQEPLRETRGRAGDHVSYPVHRSHFPGFERCMEEAPGRTLNGDLYVINELQRVNAPRRMGQIHEFSLDEIYVRLYLYFVFLKTG
ncbi:hypothetical protein ACOSQ2_030477 [Xanthoceras sorbifolium]